MDLRKWQSLGDPRRWQSLGDPPEKVADNAKKRRRRPFNYSKGLGLCVVVNTSKSIIDTVDHRSSEGS